MSTGDALRLLNLGCGSTFHPAWVNLDVAPVDASILQWDVKRGLPFEDEAFDAVYCSHVLEHLAREDAHRFVADCFRVVKRGGTARFVVPDLEGITREYLGLVEALRQGAPGRTKDYDWIVLELLDQVAREQSGGDMARFLRTLDPVERDYVLSRIGEEAQRAWAGGQVRPTLWTRIARMGIGRAVAKLRQRTALAAVRVLAGREAAKALQAGLFRQGGEVHRWMYDEVSLSAILHGAGFEGVSRCAAGTSSIPAFASFALDTNEKGEARKPDSLFVEGRRPFGAQGPAAPRHKGIAKP
jgi:SAM-dependent methyltransferase